jgi:broad specificity phosphatase PhoE
MNRILVAFLIVLVASKGVCQEKPITTFILVRHAEKDLTQSTSDPDLSAAGKARVSKLHDLLRQTQIDVVYSTNFKRTKQTVEPLAISRSLDLRLYDSKNDREIDAMFQKHRGKTILVSGHSNTIPALLNYLLGVDTYTPFDDGEYGNVVIVSLTEKGKDAKVVWLNY